MDNAQPKPEVVQALLLILWQRNMPVLLQRLDVLDTAAAAALNHILDVNLRQQAIAQAHNLAGSLGMFGYAEGTNLAREIELLLEAPDTPPAQRLLDLTAALRSTLFPPQQLTTDN